MQQLFIGVMSGNSLDNVDVVLVDFTTRCGKLVAKNSIEISAELRSRANAVNSDTSFIEITKLDYIFANLFADAIVTLLNKTKITPSKIKAIGCHGQTLYHAPDGQYPCTLQIGNANIIAAKTNIAVVADFRSRDLAEGGVGAPLAPIFHEVAFTNNGSDTVVLNIGGIANISLLSNNGSNVIGFDTGPGNCLLDYWTNNNFSQSYDKGGKIARSGELNNELLQLMLKDPYFKLFPPKSTGKDYFNEAWLHKYLPTQCNSNDILTTITHLTAVSIASSIKSHIDNGTIIIAGGGARNDFLVDLIKMYAKDFTVKTSSFYGYDPQLLEAFCLAYLAKLHIDKQDVNLKHITGAKRHYYPGVFHPAAVTN